jgi:hypothetical protein
MGLPHDLLRQILSTVQGATPTLSDFTIVFHFGSSALRDNGKPLQFHFDAAPKIRKVRLDNGKADSLDHATPKFHLHLPWSQLEEVTILSNGGDGLLQELVKPGSGPFKLRKLFYQTRRTDSHPSFHQLAGLRTLPNLETVTICFTTHTYIGGPSDPPSGLDHLRLRSLRQLEITGPWDVLLDAPRRRAIHTIDCFHNHSFPMSVTAPYTHKAHHQEAL